jgi:alkaline phosphatase
MKQTYVAKSLFAWLLVTMVAGGIISAQEEILHYHNVIILIPDGCGVSHMTIARWCKGAPLTQDSMDVSLVRTFSANSMITGSAASATAFATGCKTWEAWPKANCLSLQPDSLLMPSGKKLADKDQWRPVATVLEGARLSGKAVGLVATCRASHATPAAFASHWHSRYDDNIIMEQMVYQGIDVLFAGGFRYLMDKTMAIPGSNAVGTRRDGENLYDVLIDQGYKVLTVKEQMNALPASTQKAWGLFAHNHLVHDIDRTEFAEHEPSLAEMTQKAIEILSRDPYGFFLMVEGSQVDWSSHDNDPVGTITDYLAFDQAVEVAFDYARSHPEQQTLILVFPDHDNGGMSLGHRTMNAYMLHPNDMRGIIENARLTADGVSRLIQEQVNRSNADKNMIRTIIAEAYGITDLTEEEMTTITTELADTQYCNLQTILGPLLSDRAGIGWTTFDHTGNDVPMFSYGCDRVPKTIDNTDIARLCARTMGFHLEDLNERLFVDAQQLFKGASVTIDTAGVGISNGQLIVEKEGKKAIFPFFKNLMIMDRGTLPLEGLVVYSLHAHKVFLPRQAKKLFDME